MAAFPRKGPLFPCPSPCRSPGLLGGWLGGKDGTMGDQKLQHILNGTFPLLTSEGRQKMEQVCSSLVEFKHPGRFSVCGRGNGRKKRCKPRELASPLTLKDINQKMVAFVQDSVNDTAELKFNLVSRALCKTISSLAEVYHLECLIEQKRRLPVASSVLRKTSHTRLASRDEIEPILRQHGQQETFAMALPTNRNGGSHSRSNIQACRHMSHFRSSPAASQAVGGGCQALDDSNMGHRMLQGMGWQPGAGLGVEGDGIKNPVQAFTRTKATAGLGFT